MPRALGYGLGLAYGPFSGGGGTPTPAISSEFPILKAQYESGGRAILAVLGDSNAANFGIRDFGANSLESRIASYLSSAGLGGCITGYFNGGDKGYAGGATTFAQYLGYYDPDATADASYAWAVLDFTIFGKQAARTTTVGHRLGWAPGFTYDRVEAFHNRFASASVFDLKIGATTVATVPINGATGLAKTAVYNVTPTTAQLDFVANTGTMHGIAFRVWDSTAPRILQVVAHGVSGATTAYWADTSTAYKAGSQIPLIGAHLYLIVLGTNDSFFGLSDAATEANLTTLINLAKAAGGDVLVGMPINARAASAYQMSPSKKAAVLAACVATGINPPIRLDTSVGYDPNTDSVDDIHYGITGTQKVVNGVGAAGSGLGGIGARLLGLS